MPERRLHTVQGPAGQFQAFSPPAKRLRRPRHQREGRRGPYPDIPLYTTQDAESVESHFTAIEYGSCVNEKGSIEGCFYEAGHVLGSATLAFNITGVKW